MDASRAITKSLEVACSSTVNICVTATFCTKNLPLMPRNRSSARETGYCDVAARVACALTQVCDATSLAGVAGEFEGHERETEVEHVDDGEKS